MKLDLLTNATVVDNAMRFESDYSNNNKLISKRLDNKESKEFNDNNEDIELEEEKNKQEII